MTGELNLWLLLLQASSCMALGLVGSYLWARKPARGHQILLICMAAGVVLPGLYIGVQHLGLGQLKSDSPGPDRVAKPLETMTLFEPAEPVLFPVDLAPVAEITPTIAPPVSPVETEPALRNPIPWALVGMGVWGVMSCLVLARLVLQFILGLRLIRGRQRVKDDSLTQALCTAQNRLSLNRPVILCFSPKISSPVIWCWFKTPILLIQDIANPTQACCDWVGVFCHELAHAKRMDHIVNLWMDLLCVAAPWHPLVWWARQRLIRLSEDVCDDWVLIQGHASTKYAESLLTLTSQKQLAVMPSIIGKDSTMKERISRIIKGRISNPRPGTGWTCLLVTVTLCSIVGMALAQPRPEEALRARIKTEARLAEARQESQDPIELDTVGKPKAIDITVIGRLNVLSRLLEQLTDQAAKTKQTLGQAKNDSDREMHEVELDTLHEQIARIEKQIQQTKHPDEEDTKFRRYRVMSNTTRTRASTSTPQKERALPPVPPVNPQGRWIPTTEPDERGNVSWHLERNSDQETKQRVLRTRHRQIQDELKAVEPDLRRRHDSGLISTQEVESKLRTLINEMGLIDAQLEEDADTPEKQLTVYKLKNGRASQIVEILIRFVARDETVVSDQDTNCLIIHAAPDTHKQLQQLIKELDMPRTVTRGSNTPGPARTVRSANSAPRLARASQLGSRPVPNSSAVTRSSTIPDTSAVTRRSTVPDTGGVTRRSTDHKLNAEVDDLRGQVKGLNDQMKEMRFLLEKLIQQKQTEKPTTSDYVF
ncbi:MAG: hypothetical protein HQ515_05390 [Phycisphaeraceae bacterium]|nr:hypothetical protein [Phycisphaeraceae bacterium]